ncbi:MAG: substrate-binding domain-containing protein [Bacteroidales bacterium]|nr:substrate-binding domain-containing protein [Bacteroidales bacterium]
MKFSDLLSVFTVALLLTSCSYGDDEIFYVGVSQCSQDEWREKMNAEMQREAMLSHEISLEIRSANDDSSKQKEDIAYFIDKKVDLLIVSPNEAGEVTPAVDEAFDAGIPVVVVDRNVTGDKYTAFISADNVQIGYMQGQYVSDNLHPGEKVIEIMGLTGSTPAMERHKGFIAGLGDAGVEIVASIDAEWSSDLACQLTDSLLRIYPDVSMIVAQNDPMANGAYRAAKALYPRNDIKFIGVDALPGKGLGVEAIINGQLDASILYPTGGDVVIQTALKILQRRSYARTTTLGTALIEESNAELMSRLSDEVQHQVSIIEALRREVDDYWEKHSAQTTLLYVFIIFMVLLCLFIVLLYHALKKVNALNSILNVQNETLDDQRKQLLTLNHELEEATHAKLMFFTNVSHDFRTPLTLIADPIEQLKVSSHLDEKEKKLVHIADKNVNVLLRLVNQILDFRKYENGKATLNLTGLNLSECMDKWMEAFSLLAFKKHIHVSFLKDEEYEYSNMLDGEKTERIFFNLMANAFKFTPENGTIDVQLTRLSIDGNDWHRFTITNSGSGISPEYIQHIFERFYQIDSSHSGGSGIGLALVKTFVDMQGGTIDVESTPKKGTVFTVTLPVTPVEGALSEPVNLISGELVVSELGDISSDENKEEFQSTILVIDDNPDVRTLVGSLFCDEYTVIEAANGTSGIQSAMYNIPDLIICDVMMPGIDGLECCKRLKKEVNTSHIPVLMLTACSLDEQRVSGLNCGADAYMAKPFNSRVLIAQVKSLIENRKRIKSVFGDGISLSEENVSKTDKDFVAEFKKAISQRLDDSELSVETLGSLFGMSRVQLYRKIKNLTNYTPIEIIRITRLKAAQQLLASSDLTIAEITYQVGFTSPSYFTKCYKEYFGENPNDTRSRKK